jgi:uncharacterized protein YaaN involved in tellurite resistance
MPNQTPPNAVPTGAPLSVATTEQVRQGLTMPEPGQIHAQPGQDRELDKKADQFVEVLMKLNPQDISARKEGSGAIEAVGTDLQRRSALKSKMLQEPVKKLMQRTDDKGDVGNALLQLRLEVEEIDPGKFDFEPGWFTRAVGLIPGVGKPVKRYFAKFESAQATIDSIVRSLELGRGQLERDNTTLAQDQHEMRVVTLQLEKTIRLAQLIDQKLEARINSELAADPERKRFIAEELLFPLRQRLMDMQQQLAVNQQGVLASEIVIRNNKELIRGVNRALNVTVSALQVGATVAIALANQKDVLQKIDTVNKTTSDLIAGTAERLKTQGVEIHKQAASSMLDMERLKAAFADVRTALEDISNFRANALPQMANTVLELERLTAEQDKAIQKMESGNAARPKLAISIE